MLKQPALAVKLEAITMRHFKLARLGVAAAAVFAATAASAAPIATWDYTVVSQFRAGTGATSGSGSGQTAGDGVTEFVPSHTSGPDAPTASTSGWSISPLELTWGRDGGSIFAGTRNGLVITTATATGGTTTASNGNTAGNVITNGAYEAANAYTTFNRGNIGADSWTLGTTIIDATLVLAAGGGSPVTPFTANYEIRFVENGAADLFVLSGLLDERFVWEGYAYSFDFTAFGLGQLNDAQCALAGVDAGCVGLTTPDVRNPNWQLQFAIKSEQIPEPATEIPEPASITLLGAGLLGLACSRHRQQKNKA